MEKIAKTKMMSSNVFLCSQPKDIQFIVIEEERKQKMVKFKMLESKFYSNLKITQIE